MSFIDVVKNIYLGLGVILLCLCMTDTAVSLDV